MADIKTIGGSALGISGWVRKSQVTDPSTGVTTVEYEGRMDALESFILAVAATPHDTITASKSPETGTATVTVTIGEDEDGGGGGSKDATERALPTVTLQGAMIQVPIYQAPRFGLGRKKEEGSSTSPLTVAEVKEIDHLLSEKGFVTTQDVTEKAAQEYAGWKSIGQDKYDEPCYTMTITWHLKRSAKDRVATLMKTAGNVLTFEQAVADLPARLRPIKPEGFEQWLTQAPSVTYTEQGIDVSVSYIGAYAFPNYYEGGTWTPPELTGEYSPTSPTNS